MQTQLSPTTTVTFFVRHSAACVKKIGVQDRNYRRCDCRKYLYIYEDGRGRRVSANTRSWKDAEAVKQWTRGFKDRSYSTKKGYKGFVGKVARWAAENGIETIQDVTADQLDKWRGAWGPDAIRRDDKIDLTTQSQLRIRLRAFFRRASALRKIPWVPTSAMRPITGKTPDRLTPAQFE